MTRTSNTTELYNPDADHWRDQIYYFSGKWFYCTALKVYSWSGKWIGSYCERPDPEVIQKYGSYFRYYSNLKDNNGDGEVLPSVVLRGFFLMDNFNKGVSLPYAEQDCLVEFFPKNECILTVIGKGRNTFGVYLIYGELNRLNNTLEVQRQYVADNDVRLHWSARELVV